MPASDDRWDVVVVGLRDPSHANMVMAVAELAHYASLPPADVERMLDEGEVPVLANLDRAEAERSAYELNELGAVVDLRMTPSSSGVFPVLKPDADRQVGVAVGGLIDDSATPPTVAAALGGLPELEPDPEAPVVRRSRPPSARRNDGLNLSLGSGADHMTPSPDRPVLTRDRDPSDLVGSPYAEPGPRRELFTESAGPPGIGEDLSSPVRRDEPAHERPGEYGVYNERPRGAATPAAGRGGAPRGASGAQQRGTAGRGAKHPAAERDGGGAAGSGGMRSATERNEGRTPAGGPRRGHGVSGQPRGGGAGSSSKARRDQGSGGSPQASAARDRGAPDRGGARKSGSGASSASGSPARARPAGASGRAPSAAPALDDRAPSSVAAKPKLPGRLESAVAAAAQPNRELELDFEAAGIQPPARIGRGPSSAPPPSPPQQSQGYGSDAMPRRTRAGNIGGTGASAAGRTSDQPGLLELLRDDGVAALMLGMCVGLVVGLITAVQLQRSDARDMLPPLEEDLAAALNDPAAVEAGELDSPEKIEDDINITLDGMERSFLWAWLLTGLPLGLATSRLRRL